MIKSNTATLAICIIYLIVCTQLVFAWERCYGTWYDDFGTSVQQIQWENNFIIGGMTRFSDDSWDPYLLKIENDGDPIWSYTYTGSSDSLEFIYSTIETVDYGFLSVGEVWHVDHGSTHLNRAYMIKTDIEGNLQWTHQETDAWKIFTSVIEPSPLKYAVTGGIWKVGPIMWLYWGVYDENSELGPGGPTQEAWHRPSSSYEHTEGHDIIKRIRPGNDVHYVMVGETLYLNYGDVNCQVYLIEVHNDGSHFRSTTFGGADEDIGYCVYCTADGGYIVVGSTQSYGAGGADVYLVKLNDHLNVQWEATYGGSKDDVGYSVLQTTEGGYLICGKTQSTPSGLEDVYIIKTDVDGNELWSKTFGHPSYYDYGYDIQQTNDGGYIVAGTRRYFEVMPPDKDNVYCIYKPYINSPSNLIINPVVYFGSELYWTDNTADEDGFEVDRKIGDTGAFTYLGSTGPNVTVFYDDDIENYYGENIYYRVRAIEEGSSSDPSNECAVTPPGIFVDNSGAIHGPRDIALDGDYNYHLVIKHRDDLWYTKSTNNGDSWSSAISLNATNPSSPSLVIADGEPFKLDSKLQSEIRANIHNAHKATNVVGDNRLQHATAVQKASENKKSRSRREFGEHRDVNVPCFCWEEAIGNNHYGIYAYLDNSGQLHKTILVSATHTVQPVIAVDDYSWISCSYISDPSNDYGKIAYFQFYYNFPFFTIDEFQNCDLPGGLRIAMDTENNPHLVWHENLVQYFAVINEIRHGTFDGFNEQVATGWVSGGYARRVSNPEVAAINSNVIEYAYNVYNCQSGTHNILYKKKGWGYHVSVTEDNDIGQAYNPCIMRNQDIVLCRGYKDTHYKVFVCYPNDPTNALELISDIHNHYDAIFVPVVLFLPHAAIAYTKNIGLGRYQLHFVIKPIQDEQNPSDGPQGSEFVYAGPFRVENIFPNPAHSKLCVRFMSPDQRRVVITLYDAAGRVCDVLYDGIASNGLNALSYDSSKLANGVYFVRIAAAEETSIQKVIIHR